MNVARGHVSVPVTPGLAKQPIVLAVALCLLLLAVARLAGWPYNSAGTQAGLSVSTPRMSLAQGALHYSVTIASSSDRTISAVFYLTQVNSLLPAWDGFAYKSAMLVYAVRRHQPQTFTWDVSPVVPASLYQLTIWFHDVSNGADRPLAGGNYGVGNFVIGDAGPLHERYGEAIAHVTGIDVDAHAGKLSATAHLHAAPAPDGATTMLSWELHPTGEINGGILYQGRDVPVDLSGAPAGDVSVTWSDSVYVPPDTYDLVLRISSDPVRGQGQEVILSRAFVEQTQPPFLRRFAPRGALSFGGATAVSKLEKGYANALDVEIQGDADAAAACTIRWQLLRVSGTAAPSRSGETTCETPTLVLPRDVASGEYQVTLTLIDSGGTGDGASDTIDLHVNVGN